MQENLPLIPDDIQQIPDELIDRLNKYYSNTGKLQPAELAICERLESAFALLINSHKRSIAIIKHQEVHNISRAQAYIDMSNAEKLFAPLQAYSKDFLRLITIESARRDIERCEARLEKFEQKPKKKSVYEWRVLMQEKDRAEQRLIKAAGLDRSDPEHADPSKYQQHLININVSPTAIASITKLMNLSVVDFDQFVEEAEIVPDDREGD